jgi:CheY-like chemotaxis protein
VPISTAKILVVEDNEPLRQLIAFSLSSRGYEVVEAADGLEALDCATKNQPDLIFMDLAMPKMTGSEAIQRLKQNPLTRDIPVIVETAFDSGEETERAFQAGAVDILHKPLSLRFLPHVIQRYVSSDQGIAANA